VQCGRCCSCSCCSTCFMKSAVLPYV